MNLNELNSFFVLEQQSDNAFKYSGYTDLSGFSVEQLWTHAITFGYKEQRTIYFDCSLNDSFYHYFLKDYREIVSRKKPQFNWKTYCCILPVRSEYYVLLDYISNLTDYGSPIVSYKPPHYSIVAETASYDYEKFPFAYGSGQWSTPTFGLVVPCKSILKRGYFMYFYDSFEGYTTDEIVEYDFNESKTLVRLDLYINGEVSDYYVEETLDPALSMTGVLFKRRTTFPNYIQSDYDEIVLEENSVISWYCSELLSHDTSGNYTNEPYNPSRNRFVMILEPYENALNIITSQNEKISRLEKEMAEIKILLKI